ncbi:MAG: metal ABC transporter permease [Rhodocyclaceae bacterium]|nr:metal ABC transporter permease [Rhodocyclaceae bacterium]
MSMLFLLPFLVGLPLAFALPWLGHYLRLRDEWLAALAVSQWAGLGAVLAAALEAPAVVGACLLALLAVLGKQIFAASGNSFHAGMILLGWAASTLMIANAPHGEAWAKAISDGQLYFAGGRELAFAWLAASAAAVFLPRWAHRLVVARFFPEHEKANRLPGGSWRLGFDVLTAFLLAAAIGALGLMGSFALLFLPPWAAYRIARNGFSAIVLAVGLGLFVYGLAFAAALSFDQPFGPTLTLLLALVCFVLRRR